MLALMVNGLSNRAIATRLVVGDETIKSHLRSVYRELAVNDRAGAVATWSGPDVEPLAAAVARLIVRPPTPTCASCTSSTTRAAR